MSRAIRSMSTAARVIMYVVVSSPCLEKFTHRLDANRFSHFVDGIYSVGWFAVARDSHSCSSYRRSREYVEESCSLDSIQSAWWTTNPEGRECLALNRSTIARTVATVTTALTLKVEISERDGNFCTKNELFHGDQAKENSQCHFLDG